MLKYNNLTKEQKTPEAINDSSTHRENPAPGGQVKEASKQ